MLNMAAVIRAVISQLTTLETHTTFFLFKSRFVRNLDVSVSVIVIVCVSLVYGFCQPINAVHSIAKVHILLLLCSQWKEIPWMVLLEASHSLSAADLYSIPL